MNEGLKALLEAIADIGTQDIYTDDSDYEARVVAMNELCLLAGDAAEGKEITEQRVELALTSFLKNKGSRC